MENNFTRSISALDKVFDFVEEFARQFEISDHIVNTLDLVIEEIFTNMVKYNAGRKEDIILRLEMENSKIIVSLIDFEDTPFDIMASSVYDLNQPAKDRPVGKLGLYLVKTVMDKVDYHHDKGKTTITMVKDLRETHV